MATVTTTTTTTTPVSGISIDRGYISSRYGKYNLTLLVLNLICFICVVAQSNSTYIRSQGWFYFVCVSGFWFCLIDILLGVCQLQNRLVRIVPYYLGSVIFHGIWCFFYLTAASAVTSHASSHPAFEGWYSATVFGFLATIAYGVVTYYRFVDWKTAPANTVTVTVAWNLMELDHQRINRKTQFQCLGRSDFFLVLFAVELLEFINVVTGDWKSLWTSRSDGTNLIRHLLWD